MTLFSARTSAEAVVAAPRTEIWKILVDPTAVAELTPFVHSIEERGEHWHWRMGGLPDLGGLGLQVAPAFTARMELTEGERIEFVHDPPAGVHERAGVEGWYALADAPHPEGGPGEATALSTSLEITLDLPLPRLSGPAVRAAMHGVMDQMGERFAANMLRRLAG